MIRKILSSCVTCGGELPVCLSSLRVASVNLLTSEDLLQEPLGVQVVQREKRSTVLNDRIQLLSRKRVLLFR